MNILFVTGHPAQVHNFRNLKTDLENKGHKVLWLATDKDISKYLLEFYNIKYALLSRPGKSILSKFINLFRNSLFTLWFIKKNRIGYAVSRVSPYVAIACYLSGKTHFALTDTETAGFYDKFFGKWVSVLLTAKSFKRNLRSDQIRFDGNIELFYLHPKRFQPVGDVSDLLNIKKDEPYVLMRFVSWDAYHDKGLTGFTDANKIKVVNEFLKYAKVFISSEQELPEALELYRIKIPPEKMHDVLAHATLFFGESATMASESAVLGTAAIYLNENWLGYTNEEEKYGLLFNYKQSLGDQKRSIEKGIELLQESNLKQKMQANREKFLQKKIDMTAFMVWFIQNYPESFKIMKENPDYQYRFK